MKNQTTFHLKKIMKFFPSTSINLAWKFQNWRETVCFVKVKVHFERNRYTPLSRKWVLKCHEIRTLFSLQQNRCVHSSIYTAVEYVCFYIESPQSITFDRAHAMRATQTQHESWLDVKTAKMHGFILNRDLKLELHL